jgi:hypothetical protein
MSILGEVLAQVTQQGVDAWHCGPSATLGALRRLADATPR